VRDEIHRILEEQNKLDIAHEEFDAQLSLSSGPTRTEPWRRLSGLHQVRGPRKLALARELWETRESYAQEIDTAPGRLVPDRSLIAAVMADPPTKRDLAGLKEFHGRASRSQLDRWWGAIERGRVTEDLPAARTSSEGPPPPRIWSEKRPEAWARLQAAKEVLATRSEELNIPVENLLTPDFLRRLCWEPPAQNSTTELGSALLALGARQWQVTLVAEALVEAFVGASQQSPVAPGSDS
jgi:ribonuclease D